MRSRARLWFLGLTAVGLLAFPYGTRADHWRNGSFHWPSGPQVEVVFGDNVADAWTSYLDEAIADWNAAPVAQDVMDVSWVPGGTSPKNCRPTAGRVELCSAKYGDTGWLASSQTWIQNDYNHIHITQMVIRLNDTYFTAAPYDTADWREYIMCQQTGLALGLGIRDEELGGTCMDYADNLASNTDPDAHDYEQLHWIYALFFDPTDPHAIEPSDGGGGGGGGRGNGRGGAQVQRAGTPGWGQLVADNGFGSVYEAAGGGGRRVVTFVTWAQ
jgi:hypothetical protein